MISPPEHRVEFIFFSDQDMPLHFWMSANEDWAREIEYDKKTSFMIFLAVALFLFFSFLLSPISILLLLLLVIIIFFPAYIFGMIGFFRGC